MGADKRWFVLRVVVLLALLGYGVYYVLWRVLAGTVNLAAWYVSIPLLIVEAFAVYQLALAIERIQPRPSDHTVSREEWEGAITACSLHGKCQNVEVFIPTYDEPEEILVQTVRAARDIDYPHVTWVLDDGQRDWLRALCSQEGVRYVTREERIGFKAGNINHALGLTDAEFVAVLDADFVALPDMIARMLPYFDDPSVAVVQAPQAFYNTNSFQHSKDGVWNEQTFFFRTVLPAKARHGGAFWCGSPSILRRSAVEAIGGISMNSVTEDLETSIALAGAGYRIAYHNQTVAVGLAPANVRTFMTQRIRWGRGAMQLLKMRRFNPLTAPGLTAEQRFEFFESMSFWFHGFVFLMEYLVPPFVLLLGVSPIVFSVAPIEFFARWVPFILAFTAGNYIAAPHTYRFLETSVYRTLYALVDLLAATQLFKREAAFAVTDKRLGGRAAFGPFLNILRGLMVFMAGALAYRLAVSQGLLPGNPGPPGIVLVSAAFAVYFIGVFWVAQDRMVTTGRDRRHSYRHALDPPLRGRVAVDGGGGEALVHDLTADGALISVDAVSAGQLSKFERVPLRLPLPRGILSVQAIPRALSPGGDRLFLHLQFPALSASEEEAVDEYLFAERAPDEMHYDDELPHAPGPSKEPSAA